LAKAHRFLLKNLEKKMNEDFVVPSGYDNLEITCPRCGSFNVVVVLENFGYYRVEKCHNCGYKSTENMIRAS
jgi:transposase-like protein